MLALRREREGATDLAQRTLPVHVDLEALGAGEMLGGELPPKHDVAIGAQERLDRVVEIPGALVTFSGRVCRRLHDDLVELRRHVLRAARGRSGIVATQHQLAAVGRHERFAREDLEEHRPEREDVRADRRVGASCLLGSAAVARAPVDDVDLAEVAEHHARSVEPAVHHALRMCVVDREADLRQRREEMPAVLAIGARGIGEPRTGDRLHRHPEPALVVAEIIDRRRTRVIESREHDRFVRGRRPLHEDITLHELVSHEALGR